MGNVKILFLDATGDGTSLECTLSQHSKLIGLDVSFGGQSLLIYLDKQTAIKLVKTLKTNISSMGVEDGNK